MGLTEKKERNKRVKWSNNHWNILKLMKDDKM